MKINHRQLVLNGLIELINDNPLPTNFANWPPIAKNLLLQTCRYYYKLAAIANHLIKKTPTPLAWCIIIIGLCELHILKKPSHAAINEMVNLIKKNRISSAAGFTNAILRRSIREQSLWEAELANEPTYLYSHPDWYINLLKESWPEHWQDILQNNNQHPPMTLRINQAKITREEYLQQIPQSTATKISGQGIILHNSTNVTELSGFNEGLISVQDEAAQLAAIILDAQPHELVLDACAAPGGKTAHILELSNPSCVAIELQAVRYNRLQENFLRLGIKAACIQGDASAPETWWDGKAFDKILLDAPCSGSGVIRRHPDIKLRRTPKNLYINLEIQKKLLTNLWPLLKTNGILLYATCSVLPDENEQQISDFLRQHPNAEVQKIPLSIGVSCQYGLQILPGNQNMDGFYYCKIKKL